MSPRMNARVQTYIRYLAKQADPDGAHPELESALLEEVERGMEEAAHKKGGREDSETAALRALGPPVKVARKLGLSGRTVWDYFHGISVGFFVFTTTYVFGLVGSQTGLGLVKVLGFAVASVIAVIAPILYKKWELIAIASGKVVVRFPFRGTRSIPIGEINNMTFEGGHLFGKRRIVLEGSDSRLVLEPQYRGFKSAILVLAAMIPSKIEAEVLDSVTPFTFRAKWKRFRGTLFPIACATSWFVVVITYILGAPPLWRFEGLSYWIVVAYVLGLVTLGLQSNFHSHPCKRGVCCFPLTIVFLASLGAPAIFLGYVMFTQWLTIMVGAAFLVGILTLVWRNRWS